MSQSSNIGNKQHQRKRNSLISVDENINGISLSLQSFVDDIPFEFNRKYQTIIVVSLYLTKIIFYLFIFIKSNIDIPEYDTNKVHQILSKSVIFIFYIFNLKRKLI